MDEVALRERLKKAVTDEDLDGVRAALASGANPNKAEPADPFSPLHSATWKNNAKIIRALLDAGADANEKHTVKGAGDSCGENTPLMVAAMQDYWVALDVLRPSSDLSQMGGKHNWTAIFFSIGKGLSNGEKCWRALKKASDLSHVDGKGRTLLHIAAEKGAEKIVRELIEIIDPATRDADGLTPLMSCVKAGCANMRTLAVLMSVCDISAVSENAKTALDLAAEGGMSDYVKRLLEKQPGLSAEQGSKAFDLALEGYTEKEAKALARMGRGREIEMRLLDLNLETLDLLAPFASEKKKETAWAALNEERHGLRRSQWESDAIRQSLEETRLGGQGGATEPENGAKNRDENGSGSNTAKKAPKRRL